MNECRGSRPVRGGSVELTLRSTRALGQAIMMGWWGGKAKRSCQVSVVVKSVCSAKIMEWFYLMR